MQNKLTTVNQPHAQPHSHLHSKRIGGSVARIGPRDQANRHPDIHIKKNGDRIESIQIACSCGEQITLVCEYED